MHKLCLYILVSILIALNVLTSCSTSSDQSKSTLSSVDLSYAQGFELAQGEGYWEVKVTQGWTGSDRIFRYLVLEEGTSRPEGKYDAVIQLPVERLIVTSTTHIPHLDMLEVTDRLIGFPQVDLISSTNVWEYIEAGAIQDLGAGPSANTEMLIDLEPDLIMFSTLGEDLKYLDVLAQAQVPAVINGEYVEQHPLGRAEWIKFTGVLVGKYEEATTAFEEVERAYLAAEQLTADLSDDARPTVLSGVMYQDIWYSPGADSWGAKILENAGGDYIFSDQSGTGSVQLNYEYVLDQALDASYWIGSSDFPSVQAMGEAEPRYKNFQAWKNGNVYSYSLKKGPKGGYEYFELGYMRPDLILKDLIKILHPDLLPTYELYFYGQLDAKD